MNWTRVLAADISSDQSLIALGGPQRVVRIYSTESGKLLHELRKHTDWIYTLEFSPDSVLLASGDRNGGLLVWEGWTGRDYLTLPGHTGGVTGVSWRADSNVLASCSEDGSIRLWEMENGNQIKNWGAHGGGVASLEYARDGRLVSCGRDRVVKLWDQNGGQQRAFEAFPDLAVRATFCDESERVIGGDWTGSIRVWNAADGAAAGELSSNPPRLADRLTAASALLATRQTELQPLVQAQQASEAALEAAKSQLATAETMLRQTEAAASDAAALANARSQFEKAGAEAKAAEENAAAAKQTADAAGGCGRRGSETSRSLAKRNRIRQVAASGSSTRHRFLTIGPIKKRASRKTPLLNSLLSLSLLNPACLSVLGRVTREDERHRSNPSNRLGRASATRAVRVRRDGAGSGSSVPTRPARQLARTRLSPLERNPRRDRT